MGPHTHIHTLTHTYTLTHTKRLARKLDILSVSLLNKDQ